MQLSTPPAVRLNRTAESHPGPLTAPPKPPHVRTALLAGARSPALPAARVASPQVAPDSLETDAERFLSRTCHGSPAELGARGWLRRAGLNVRRASDAQHLEAIALAYAAHLQVIASPERETIMAELASAAGTKRRRTTHDLHLLVDHFVSYGGDTPAERLAARKLVSRDVRAIEHLHRRRVRPSAVQELGRKPGEGLHAWAGRRAAERKAKPTVISPDEARALASAERRERALTYDVVVTTRRPDGSCKRRRCFTITGVTHDEFDVALRRMQALGNIQNTSLSSPASKYSLNKANSKQRL